MPSDEAGSLSVKVDIIDHVDPQYGFSDSLYA
jgi:hypothetical protein